LTGKKNLIKNKNKISSFIKDNLNAVINESLSRVVLFKIELDEFKQEKKKNMFESLFSTAFEIDENEKISIKSTLSELEDNTEELKITLSQSSQMIMSAATTTIKRLETDVYKTLSNIVDRIERTEVRTEARIKDLEEFNSMHAITFMCSEETEKVVIKDNLKVKQYTDYHELDKQQAMFQLFVGGLLQINDTADKGDYILSLDENNDLVAFFHEMIPAETTISIFAIKSR
jgi:hypothetical protein